MEAGGTIIVVTHIVFAGPQQLHGCAGQTGFSTLIRDEPGDLRNFDVVFAVQAPAEPASGPNHMECDIVVLNTRRHRSVSLLRNLARRPDFELTVLVMGRGILRLEWSVRQQREGILGFNDLGRGLERRFSVTVFRASWTAARWGLRYLRRRELFGLSEIPGATLRSDRTLVPNNLQRLARIVRQPPVVGDDGNSGSPSHDRSTGAPAWGGRRLRRCGNHKRMLDAGQFLDFVQIRAHHLAAKHRAFFINCEEHVWRIDVDAESRLSGNDCEIVDSRSPLSNDFEILRILQFHRGEFGHGHVQCRFRQRRIRRCTFAGCVRHDP